MPAGARASHRGQVVEILEFWRAPPMRAAAVLHGWWLYTANSGGDRTAGSTIGDAVLLQAGSKLRARQAEQARGLRLVVAGARERIDDQLPLRRAQRACGRRSAA